MNVVLLGLCLGLLGALPTDGLRSRYESDGTDPTLAGNINSGDREIVLDTGPPSGPKGPGFGLTITQEGITETNEFLAPFIFDSLTDLDLDNVAFSGGKLTNLRMDIHEPELADLNVTLVEEGNAIEVSAKNLKGKVVSNFSYSYWIVHANGEAHMNIKRASLRTLLNLSTQNSTIQNSTSAELAPCVHTDDFDIVVNPADVDIELHGDVGAWLADKLIPLLKGSVIPAALKQWREKSKSFINTRLNKDLASRGTRAQIPYFANVTFDFAQMGMGPRISNHELSMTMNGTFFDAEHVRASEYWPAAFIVRDPKGRRSKEVQVVLTDYVVNTALFSALSAQRILDLTLLLEKTLNSSVSTDTLDPFLPGLTSKYGSGKPLNLSGRLTEKGGTSFFTPNGQRIDLSLAVTGSVDNDVFLQAEFVDVAVAGSLRSDAGKVFGNISKSSLGALRPGTFQTTLDLSADEFVSNLQATLDSRASKLNNSLRDGWVVPTFLGVSVRDFEVHFFEGYLQCGFSFSRGFRDVVRKAVDGLIR